MLTIGQYQLIHSENFILPESESAILRVRIEDEDINCRITFVQDHSRRESIGISSDADPGDPDMAIITLKNWDRPTRIFTPEPFNFFELDSGKRIFAVISSIYQSGQYLVFLQYLLEGDQ
ncbi:MAG: DUF6864 domain-containing function [Stenotrophomonas maltophilia]|jgi:hypothetical protein